MATEVIIPNQEMKLGANKVSIPGGFTPVPDPEHNAHIISLANWAIDEHNKNTVDKLKLVKIFFASQQRKGMFNTTSFMVFEASHLLLGLPNVLCEAIVLEIGNPKFSGFRIELAKFEIIGNVVENTG